MHWDDMGNVNGTSGLGSHWRLREKGQRAAGATDGKHIVVV
jgi:hypothetical protein